MSFDGAAYYGLVAGNAQPSSSTTPGRGRGRGGPTRPLIQRPARDSPVVATQHNANLYNYYGNDALYHAQPQQAHFQPSATQQQYQYQYQPSVPYTQAALRHPLPAAPGSYVPHLPANPSTTAASLPAYSAGAPSRVQHALPPRPGLPSRPISQPVAAAAAASSLPVPPFLHRQQQQQPWPDVHAAASTSALPAAPAAFNEQTSQTPSAIYALPKAPTFDAVEASHDTQRIHRQRQAQVSLGAPQAGSDSHRASQPSTFHAPAKRPYCEVCKIPYKDPIYLIAHQRNEHIKCCKSEEGCTFEALPHIVEIHEQDRHLVFKPGAKPEHTKPDGPPNARIQGTNLRLETEEDIAKWIEERKRKWPSSKNAELRAERDAKRRAYEEASPANTWKRNDPKTTHSPAQKKMRTWGQVSTIDGASSEASGNQSKGTPLREAHAAEERDQGMEGVSVERAEAMPATMDGETSNDAVEIENEDEDDDDDQEVAAQLLRAPSDSALMLAQRQDNFREESVDVGSDDDEPPEEYPTGPHSRSRDYVRAPEMADSRQYRSVTPVSQESQGEDESTRDSLAAGDVDRDEAAQRSEGAQGEESFNNRDHADVGDGVDGQQSHERQQGHPEKKQCIAWQTTGNCKFGKRCIYAHEPHLRGVGGHPLHHQHRALPPQPPTKPANPFQRDGLLGKLLHNEVKHEISDLLQVIDFLARNRFLEDVELYPGHKQELESRIKVVDRTASSSNGNDSAKTAQAGTVEREEVLST